MSKKISDKHRLALIKMAVLGFYRVTKDLNQIAMELGDESEIDRLFDFSRPNLTIDVSENGSNVVCLKEWKSRNNFDD